LRRQGDNANLLPNSFSTVFGYTNQGRIGVGEIIQTLGFYDEGGTQRSGGVWALNYYDDAELL
jgi:hypothetical protein